MRLRTACRAGLFCALLAATAAAAPTTRDAAALDLYLRGYVESVVQREALVPAGRVRVDQGTVTVNVDGLGEAERRRLYAELARAPGVASVAFVESEPTPSADGFETPGEGSDEAQQGFFLNRARLFDPLLADPRWPHFYAIYQRAAEGNPRFHNVANVGFGDTIGLYRANLPGGVRLEGGVQAAVFAAFDLGAPSMAQLTADYFVGPVVALRRGDLSGLVRLYHQSSHLGDEYLLQSGVERRNFSYEAVDLLASYDLGGGLRVYGGPGYLINTRPDDLDRFFAHYGLEYAPDVSFAGGLIHPVAALDVQHRAYTNWNADVSLRGGLDFAEPSRYVHRMQVLLEYYDGGSRNGQFYPDRVRTVGVGLHFFL